MSTSTSAKAKLLLSGLGKATRRGVRRCPKCGTINGTRGLSCKNRNCDMIFKEGSKALSGDKNVDEGLSSKASERVARFALKFEFLAWTTRQLFKFDPTHWQTTLHSLCMH